MATYLLTWNPKLSDWDKLPALVSKLRKGLSTTWPCSCGRSKRITKGDRVFMIRLGQKPIGIFASGWVIKGSHSRPHWDPKRASKGEQSLFVNVQFDILLNLHQDQIFCGEQLDIPPFTKKWCSQSSGITIPDNVAAILEIRWAYFAGDSLPEEVIDTTSLYEGAVKRISVNAYERNVIARQRCLSIYGARCSICKIDLKDIYGEVGRDLIHIHHLKPLSKIGQEYKVDPALDLLPVCPNCHAIIHRREPPYTVKEVKKFLEKGKQTLLD
jgi:5-methylcytosine-specific restriction enzyme A